MERRIPSISEEKEINQINEKICEAVKDAAKQSGMWKSAGEKRENNCDWFGKESREMKKK